MSKTLFLAALAGACVYGGLALAKQPDPPKSDAAFLAMAAEADMITAHLGKLAQERAAASQVKQFASSLVADHTNDYQRLTELAGKLGDSIPKAIDNRNGRIVSEFDHRRGQSFDRAFLANQSAEHEKLISAFKWEAEHGPNPDIKAYANKTLPTIERHLHDAENLMKQRS